MNPLAIGYSIDNFIKNGVLGIKRKKNETIFFFCNGESKIAANEELQNIEANESTS